MEHGRTTTVTLLLNYRPEIITDYAGEALKLANQNNHIEIAAIIEAGILSLTESTVC